MIFVYVCVTYLKINLNNAYYGGNISDSLDQSIAISSKPSNLIGREHLSPYLKEV